MVAASAPLGPDGWAEIRRASEMGVDDVTLSDKYSVTRAAIRKRREREKWITLSKLEETVEAYRVTRMENLVGNGSLSQPVTNSPKALETVAESLLANGEAGSLLMSQIGLASLKKAMTPEGMLKIAPLSNIGDVMTAGKAVRLAAGMDKASAANVSVNLAMFSGEEKGWSVSGEQDESQ